MIGSNRLGGFAYKNKQKSIRSLCKRITDRSEPGTDRPRSFSISLKSGRWQTKIFAQSSYYYLLTDSDRDWSFFIRVQFYILSNFIWASIQHLE